MATVVTSVVKRVDLTLNTIGVGGVSAHVTVRLRVNASALCR